MAATHDLVNGTDAAITGWGGSAVNVPARSVAVAATLTDAQAILGAQAAGCSVMVASSTAAGKSAVAGVLVGASAPTLSLATAAAREQTRLRNSIQDGQDALRVLTA